MENTMIAEKQPLTEEYLQKMDAYWRAANYLRRHSCTCWTTRASQTSYP